MINIDLEHQRVQQALARVEWAVGELAPLMRGIAAELASITEENFENEGQSGEPWPALSEVTTNRRELARTWPGQMLQVTAGAWPLRSPPRQPTAAPWSAATSPMPP